jgi:hypothetical protein
MYGHSNGTGQDHKLDVVGGVYDHAPSVYPAVVEKEYAKLEPFLNIYSGKVQSQDVGLSGDELENLRWLARQVKEGKAKIVKIEP